MGFEQILSVNLLCFLSIVFRSLAMVSVFPVIGERFAPMRVKLAVGIALAVIAFPLLRQQMLDAFDRKSLIQIILCEVVAGLLFGILMRFVSFALQICGAIIGQTTSLAQLVGMSSFDPQSALGNTLYLMGLLFLMISGFHMIFLSYFIASYQALPPGNLPSQAIMNFPVTTLGPTLFALAVSLSAPFIIVAVLYNFALGIFSKAMPQLMVALVGAPFITGLALLVLLLTFPQILNLWLDQILGFVEMIRGAHGG